MCILYIYIYIYIYIADPVLEGVVCYRASSRERVLLRRSNYTHQDSPRTQRRQPGSQKVSETGSIREHGPYFRARAQATEGVRVGSAQVGNRRPPAAKLEAREFKLFYYYYYCYYYELCNYKYYCYYYYYHYYCYYYYYYYYY